MTPSEILAADFDINDSGPSDELCRVISEAVNNDDVKNFASFMLDGIKEPRPLEKLTYIIDVAAWIVPDNGSEAQRTMEQWLYGSEQDRIWIALHTECYPFICNKEMNDCLNDLSARFPRFRNRCLELIESRSKDGV